MNIKVVLGALGLDPEKIEGQLDAFTKGVPAAIQSFDERLSRVEQNQVLTNRLIQELINGR